MHVLKTQNSANLENVLEEMALSLMNNINLLITCVRRRYAVVFLCSLPSQMIVCALTCLFTMTFPGHSVRFRAVNGF